MFLNVHALNLLQIERKVDAKMKTGCAPVDLDGLPCKEHTCWSVVLNCSGCPWRYCFYYIKLLASFPETVGILKTADSREKYIFFLVTKVHEWCINCKSWFQCLYLVPPQSSSVVVPKPLPAVNGVGPQCLVELCAPLNLVGLLVFKLGTTLCYGPTIWTVDHYLRVVVSRWLSRYYMG